MLRIALLLLSIGCAGCSTESSEQGLAAADPVADPAVTEAPTTKNLQTQPRIAKPVDGMDVADEYTRQFYAGEVDALFAKFSEEMKGMIPLDDFRVNQGKFESHFGKQTALVNQEAKVDGGMRSFTRWARFENFDGVVSVEWILHEDDTIAGFFIRNSPPPE